jgi:hypothetical protein
MRVAVAMGYGLECQGSIPGTYEISLFSIASRPPLGSTQPPIQWLPAADSPRVKQQRREADHSPISSAEVKNDGAVPSLNVFMACCFTFYKKKGQKIVNFTLM